MTETWVSTSTVLTALAPESELCGRLLAPRFLQLGHEAKSLSQLVIVEQGRKAERKYLLALVTAKLQSRGVGVKKPALEIM